MYQERSRKICYYYYYYSSAIPRRFHVWIHLLGCYQLMCNGCNRSLDQKNIYPHASVQGNQKFSIFAKSSHGQIRVWPFMIKNKDLRAQLMVAINFPPLKTFIWSTHLGEMKILYCFLKNSHGQKGMALLDFPQGLER